jgi:hypothetical protein
MKGLCWFVVTALSVFTTTPEMYGQASTAPAAQTEGWQIQVEAYLWGSDFKGRMGIFDRSTEVDASFSDILDQFNFGFMGVLGATRGRFVTATDIVYINLSTDKMAALARSSRTLRP